MVVLPAKVRVSGKQLTADNQQFGFNSAKIKMETI